MKLVRWLVGRLVLLYAWLFAPRSPKRSVAEQNRIDKEVAGLTMYQFAACPFCVKVRFAMKRLGLNIELRDARRNSAYRDELLTGGGEYKVPCLRITDVNGETQWLYESSDIIRYLEQRFAGAAA